MLATFLLRGFARPLSWAGQLVTGLIVTLGLGGCERHQPDNDHSHGTPASTAVYVDQNFDELANWSQDSTCKSKLAYDPETKDWYALADESVPKSVVFACPILDLLKRYPDVKPTKLTLSGQVMAPSNARAKLVFQVIRQPTGSIADSVIADATRSVVDLVGGKYDSWQSFDKVSFTLPAVATLKPEDVLTCYLQWIKPANGVGTGLVKANYLRVTAE